MGRTARRGDRVLSPVVVLLKQQTASIHEQVETCLGLLDPRLSPSRLGVVLARFAGFWHVAERPIDEWASEHPEAALALNWPRRRRGTALRHDLLRLGLGTGELAAPALPAPPFRASCPTDAEVLGWLYVSEGSTLGGAVIDRTLRSQPGGAPLAGLHTFSPYPEGPGPMWRAYLDYLQQWVGDDAGRRDAVVDAGQACFAALADWLAPLAATVLA
jgi:heme oxygenase